MCHKRHLKACKRHQTVKGCKFGSDCAYEHRESETSKAPTNELEKKIEVLETIVVEMANKLLKLEAELNDIKSVQNKSEHIE